MKRVLIAYFSATSMTEKMAGYIAEGVRFSGKEVVTKRIGDIIGPYAPILIQEVVNATASGGGIDQIQASMHIHPAISELIPEVLSNLENPST